MQYVNQLQYAALPCFNLLGLVGLVLWKGFDFEMMNNSEPKMSQNLGTSSWGAPIYSMHGLKHPQTIDTPPTSAKKGSIGLTTLESLDMPSARDVRPLRGGFKAWQAKGLPVAKVGKNGKNASNAEH